MNEGSLIVVKKNGSEGSKFPMHKENVYKIGPGADCNLRFNIDNYTENVCAISTNKKGPATISKLSSCPVILNNAEIKTPKPLKYGDVIRIGTKIFKWGSLIRRDSFTTTVFKNKTPTLSTKKFNFKGKRRSSLRDFCSSGGRNVDRLSTWRETEENVKTTSKDEGNIENIAISNSPMKLTSSETEQKLASGKSKTLPKNHGSQNKTPSESVVKSLKFPSRSVDKKSTPVKKKYFDSNFSGIPSKIPRKFFTDKPTTRKITKVNTKPLKKKADPKPEASGNILEEFKENMKTPTQKTEKRIYTRSENKKDTKLIITPVALTEVNVRTPDSVGFKPGTPNIKLVKSVNKKNASLKKSFDNKTLAKKRKISSVADDELFTTKRFKFTDNSEAENMSLLQDESMESLFENSLSLMEQSSSNSPRRSVRKQYHSANLCNISEIKSLMRNTAKNRQSLQLKTPKNEPDIKRRFTETNLISFKTPESEVRMIKLTCSTPKAQCYLPIEQVRRSPGRPPKTPKNDLINVSGVKKLIRTPGRSPKSPKNDLTNIAAVKKLLRTSDRPPKSPKNDLTNITGVKKLLRTPGRPPKSPKNDLTNIAGVKKLLKTPGRPPKSPKNDLTNIAGVKKLLRTPGRPPKSPKNDLTNIAGVKKLLRTPGRPPKSPKNDLTNIAGVKRLLRTPSQPPKSPKNDLTNIAGVKKLLRTPGRPPKSPKNDLTNIAGVKKLLRTPGRPPKSPKNDLTDVRGVKTLFRPQNSPKNDLNYVAGVKKLLGSPRRPRKSPKNDLTNISGIKNLLKSPGRPPNSPKNDLSNVSGIKNLFTSPERLRKSLKNDVINMMGIKTPIRSPDRPLKSSKNDLTNVSGIENLLTSPRTPKSPKNDIGGKHLLRSPNFADISTIKSIKKSPGRFRTSNNYLHNVSDIKSTVSTPQNENSPKHDTSNIDGAKEMLKTPGRKSKTPDVQGLKKLMSPRLIKKQNEVKNDLSDIEGVDSLFNISKLNSSTKDMDTAFDQLKNENNDSLNLTFAINSKSPLRTYERRGNSLSPPKLQKLTDHRKSLRVFSDSTNKENVQKWLNEHVLSKSKSSEKTHSPAVKKNLRNQLQEVEEVFTPKHKQHLILETENLTPSSPTTRSRRAKKVAENEENIVTPPKARRTRKVEEPEVIAPRTRRNNVKTTEVVEQPKNSRAMRKRTAKDEKLTEEVASKRPRKQTDEVKQVHFEVPETEEIEENKPASKNRRGKKAQEITETNINEPEKKITRNRRAKNIEEKPAEEESREKISTTRSRKTKKNDEIEEKPIVTRSRRGKKTEEPEKKKSTRSKKNEEIVESVEVEEKTVTRKARAKKNENPAPEEVTKKPVKRGGKQKKTEETVEIRPTRSKKQKVEENPSATRGKKVVVAEEEPVQRSTRTRRNK